MTATAEDQGYAGWSILELMGHRRLAGFVQEVELAGQGMWRLDVPGRDEFVAGVDLSTVSHLKLDDGGACEIEATQFYSPAAVYCLTPTTSETARAVAASARPRPAQRWELEPARQDDDDGGPF